MTTMPVSGVLNTANLKSLENWRALLHQVAPVVVTAMVALHVAGGDPDKIGVYVALFFAVADPLLSFTNSTDTARRIIYGVLGLAQTGGLVTTLFVGQEVIIPVVTAGVTIINAFLARFYTPTTTIVDTGQVAHAEAPRDPDVPYVRPADPPTTRRSLP